MEGRYLVVIQVPSPRGARQPGGYQLSYEVVHLRQGQNKWFLVSKEELPKPSDSASPERLQPSPGK
ncbi:MAG: hypothetical protein M1423_03925 [Acidobacteria bacterium]|nr:hypothetical protein [Acidobacteriota bacterium]